MKNTLKTVCDEEFMKEQEDKGWIIVSRDEKTLVTAFEREADFIWQGVK